MLKIQVGSGEIFSLEETTLLDGEEEEEEEDDDFEDGYDDMDEEAEDDDWQDLEVTEIPGAEQHQESCPQHSSKLVQMHPDYLLDRQMLLVEGMEEEEEEVVADTSVPSQQSRRRGRRMADRGRSVTIQEGTGISRQVREGA